jgi:uncharacterized protein YlxW (UPF0749 family)
MKWHSLFATHSVPTHIGLKSWKTAQQTANCQINAVEAGQCELSTQESAIEAELLDISESTNRAERELSELATEIATVTSTCATAREILSRRVDEADKLLTRSE